MANKRRYKGFDYEARKPKPSPERPKTPVRRKSAKKGK